MGRRADHAGLHERRKQLEHLPGVESAFFILRLTSHHVLFASPEVHGFSENVLGLVVAKVFAGAGKSTKSLFVNNVALSKRNPRDDFVWFSCVVTI